MAGSGVVSDIRVDRRDISCQSDFEKNKKIIFGNKSIGCSFLNY